MCREEQYFINIVDEKIKHNKNSTLLIWKESFKVNILFLTIGNIDNLDDRGIYQDLFREFVKCGEKVYIISPVERSNNQKTYIIKKNGWEILKVKTGNIQKTNIIEKGISTILIERQFISAIKKYYRKIHFDLVIYSTPPVTLARVILYMKKHYNVKSYLMLKDIFPQNSIDLGILKKNGIKGIIYRYFKIKEKKLYELSDVIGCTSEANIKYIITHNSFNKEKIVEYCPNCSDLCDLSLSKNDKINMRVKYDLPLDKKIFVYGGNLGRPQNIPFIVQCLEACKEIEKVYFLIVGSGTDKHYLDDYIKKENCKHVKVLGQLPKNEYDSMIACCDCGMIFLDYKFTVPNTPARLLSYIQAGIPILTCTDIATDVGDIVEKNGFGWKCTSNNVENFVNMIKYIIKQNVDNSMKENGLKYLEENYIPKVGYDAIMKHLN